MADLVRQGAVFADIGTDHGYLPLFLLEEGRIDRAILTDVNEAPLSSARATVSERGFSERVKLVLTDGLMGLENEGATDIAICGMGGDLISRIISEASFIRKKGVRLLLQPMTRQGTLRETLSELGFEIKTERYSESSGKYYLGIAAEYTGVTKTLTRIEAELGNGSFLPRDREAYLGYIKAKLRAYERIADGRRLAGEDTVKTEELISRAAELIGSLE